MEINCIIMELINNRNTMVKKFQYGDYYILDTGDVSSEEEIECIEESFGFMPVELKEFYSEIGSIYDSSRLDNTYSFNIISVKKLLHNISERGWFKLNSTGIVDMIKFSWGNDRPEFDEHIKDEDLKCLNDNYKCIGWYRGSWGTEEANYIYFDRMGSYGVVRYHQDYFDDLLKEYIQPLLSKSQAKFSLDNLFRKCFENIEEDMNENLHYVK